MSDDDAPISNLHHHRALAKAKPSDGGFWSALAGFALLLMLAATGSDQIKQFYVADIGVKIDTLAASVLLGLNAIYRKFKFHDYTLRQYWTNLFIWMILAFSLPSLIYYLFFYQQ